MGPGRKLPVEDEPGSAIVDKVRDLRWREPGVDRYRDGTREQSRKKGQRPVEAVAQLDGNAITPMNASGL
jgi:hypothetical protein